MAQKSEDRSDVTQSDLKSGTPTNIKAAWEIITANLAEADKHIAGQDEFTRITERLEAAVHFLQQNLPNLVGEKQIRLVSALKQLGQSIIGLRRATQAKDTAWIDIEIKKMKQLLPLIQAQYPVGSLR